MIPHDHCPLGCWHPQPFSLLVTCGDSVVDVAYCGRCWHEERIFTPMAPCTPTICPDEAPAGEPQPSESA